MDRVAENSTGSFILSTSYGTPKTRHTDYFYCGGVNMWRDYFTDDHKKIILGSELGETVTLLEDHQYIPRNNSLIRRVKKENWQPASMHNQTLRPRLGRWYPQGIMRNLPGVFPQSTNPMRITADYGEACEVDYNHPLAGKNLSIRVQINELSSTTKERGGRCTDWIEEALANGPGIELFLDEGEVDFEEPEKMTRVADGSDSHFYAQPRLVNHIDETARGHLLGVSKKIINPDMRVLDLMSSMQSHLPPCQSVTGLGMNAEEMQANSILTEHLVHDLNAQTAIPFSSQSFAAICCHLSFEYLLYPEKVLEECYRLLTDDGVLLISFSNRWFPEKVTRIWQLLHEFERVGYVMQHVVREFSNIETFSFRNWPRPYDDPHYMQVQTSDPVYVIVAGKSG